MRNNELIGELLKIKLELADRMTGLLPAPVQATVRELEKDILTVVRDALDQHLQSRPETASPKGGLKKIELE